MSASNLSVCVHLHLTSLSLLLLPYLITLHTFHYYYILPLLSSSFLSMNNLKITKVNAACRYVGMHDRSINVPCLLAAFQMMHGTRLGSMRSERYEEVYIRYRRSEMGCISIFLLGGGIVRARGRCGAGHLWICYVLLLFIHTISSAEALCRRYIHNDVYDRGACCHIYNLLSNAARCCSPGQCASGQTCLIASRICLTQRLALMLPSFFYSVWYGGSNLPNMDNL